MYAVAARNVGPTFTCIQSSELLSALMRAQLEFRAKLSAARLCTLTPRASALADQSALELGDCGKQCAEQVPIGLSSHSGFCLGGVPLSRGRVMMNSVNSPTLV